MMVKLNESKSRILIANPVLYSLKVLTINVNLLSGDDGDSMVASGAHHLTNLTPCPGTADVLLIKIVIGLAAQRLSLVPLWTLPQTYT